MLACRRTDIRSIRSFRAYSAHADEHHDHHDDHHHHHAVSYQHLEKPAITPETFHPLGEYKSFESVPALQKETLLRNHGNLIAEKNHPNKCWSEQVINSPSVLECFAELFGTEFKFWKHTPRLLSATYRLQLRLFREVKVPQLQAEGISQVTIDLLHEMYILRANVPQFEIARVVKGLGGGKKPVRGIKEYVQNLLGLDSSKEIWANYGMRVTSDGSEPFEEPLVKSTFVGDFIQDRKMYLNSFLFSPAVLPSNQVVEGGFTTTADLAAHNVKTFKYVQAFVNAVNRGLTDAEKDQMIFKLKQFQGLELVDPTFDREIRGYLKNMVDAYKVNGDMAAVREKSHQFRHQYCVENNNVHGIHARQLVDQALDYISNLGHDDSQEDTDGLYLREGLDYFSGEEQRKSFLDELTAWFKYKASLAHHEVMTTGTPEKKKMSTKLYEATNFFLSPKTQKDLEILSLLRSSDLSFKQKDEFLQIFGKDASLQTPKMSDEVLLNVIHPHAITMNLFGDQFISFLARDNVEYTNYFTDGSDSCVLHDHELSDRSKANLERAMEAGALVSPRITAPFLSTAQDQVNHLKMMRLLEDYYGIDLETEEGMAMVDHLVHTYDISPGEQTLERSQPIPMPEHTFDELPIMKFDGWEDSDVAPLPDTYIDTLDLSAVERTLSLFLKDLSSKTGEPITLSSYKENNKLSDYQYKVLRSVLHLERKDERRIHLMEKIWGTVLPRSELDRLFDDQYHKFDENHH